MRDQLLTIGYIRASYTETEIKTLQPLPADLLQLLSQFYSNEMVYLLYPDTKQCFTINLDEILNDAI